MPPVDTPNASSSQVPETTNTDSPAIAVVAEPTMTSHAVGVIAARRTIGVAGSRSSITTAGVHLGRLDATTNVATADAPASTTKGPRQPNRLINTATIGAPTSSAIAHDVSNSPSMRPVGRSGRDG